MNLWEEIKEGYTDELERCWDKYRQSRELTGGMLETIDKLAHTIKSVATIEAMEGSGYSSEGNYNGNYSNAGRRRDSMGRYSREDGRSYNSYNNSYAGRRGGYSRDEARDELMSHLQGMMSNADDEHSRAMIKKWMDQAEREL